MRAMGTSTSVGKYMNTPKSTPMRLAHSVLRPPPGWGDDRLRHPCHEHTDDQQREDLLDKLPHLPEPLADLRPREASRRHGADSRQQKRLGDQASRHANDQAAL